MITITKLDISNDLTKLSLSIEVGTGKVVNLLKSWDSTNFKDSVLELDLSAKLTGITNIETLEFTPSELNVSDFSGMHFFEIGSDDTEDLNAVISAINLRQYYSTVAALLYSVRPSNLSSNTNFQNALLLDLYIEGIRTGLQVGRFQDAIGFFNKINIITSSSECADCFNKSVLGSGTEWVSVGVIDSILTND